MPPGVAPNSDGTWVYPKVRVGEGCSELSPFASTMPGTCAPVHVSVKVTARLPDPRISVCALKQKLSSSNGSFLTGQTSCHVR